jgi:uncharacterized protein DUF3465
MALTCRTRAAHCVSPMKRTIAVAIAFAAVYFGVQSGLLPRQDDPGNGSSSGTDTVVKGADQTLAAAVENHRSNVQVHASGQVAKVLADDNDGSRHQRFIVRLPSGHTVLVAHNIDLASRVAALSSGDPVEFYGEYEWNAKGGVVHWTHRDPRGRHADGWIKHDGQTYQ